MICVAEISSALRKVIKYEGYKGLFRGLGSTLLRDVPFSGMINYKTKIKIKNYLFS